MRAYGIRCRRGIAGLLAAAGLASCAAPGDQSGAAIAGNDTEAGARAPTFVSLNPCLDAILVEVADPAQILALSHYSRDPSSSSMRPEIAARFAYTGGTAEEVLALGPDIVLASRFIAPATRAALERAGLMVETFGSPASTQDSIAQVRKMAQLTGHDADKGAALAERIEHSPQTPDLTKPALTKPAGANITAMLWQPGQIVAGEATLAADHLRWAGFANYSAARGLRQADYVSLENVLADPPDILLVAGDSAGQRHPLLAELRGTTVAEFSPNLLYCGGPSIPLARARLLDIRESFERDFHRARQ